MVKPTEAAPCWGLIGPSESTDGAELFGGFRAFYRPLLIGNDADAAVKAIVSWRLDDGNFLVEIAENWFFKTIEGYLNIDCTMERIRERAEDIRATIHDEINARPIEIRGEFKVPSLEQIIKIGQQRAQEFIDDYFEKFFMVDRIKENHERFSEGLNNAKHKAKEFFEAQGYKIGKQA
jgi:hypothetical protein